ncbi:MAG: hypothetical protein FWF85_00430 [Clostridiales bacterium]|nr:hypothetical protein [Clostridiales bacterium]
MPIPIPDLGDRNYDQLLSETSRVIDRYFPEYSDIGPSDPATTVNELFCYLFDIASSQLNRISAETRLNFAVLLGIEKVYGRPPEEAVRLALNSLSRIERAVTADDIVTVIKNTSQTPKAGYSEPVVRAYVLSGAPVTVFVVQKGAVTGGITTGHKQDLILLYKALRTSSPICTRYLLRHAPVLTFDLALEISKRRDSTLPEASLITKAKNTLSAFFDPLKGGDSGTGWEFGRAVSRSEIYGLIERIPEVDHVDLLRIKESAKPNYEGADELQPALGGLVKMKQPTIKVV